MKKGEALWIGGLEIKKLANFKYFGVQFSRGNSVSQEVACP